MIILEPIIDSIEYKDITDDEYFSDKYKDYISNSRLSLINPEQGGSPEKYLNGLKNSVSDSLYFGSAVHEMILQPESFHIEKSVDRPTAKMGFMADYLYKYYLKGGLSIEDVIEASDKIDYYKGKMDDKKIYNVFEKCTPYWESRSKLKDNDKIPIFLDEKSRNKLYKCLESVNNNIEIQDLLHPKGIVEDPLSMNEAALFIDVKAKFEDKECILKLKAKLDNFTIDFESNKIVLNDLKTTGHFIDQFENSFKKYCYYRQMALYIWMLTLYAKKYHNISKISSLNANMLLISTIPDFKSGIYKVSKQEISKGYNEFKFLLQEVAKLYLC